MKNNSINNTILLVDQKKCKVSMRIEKKKNN